MPPPTSVRPEWVSEILEILDRQEKVGKKTGSSVERIEDELLLQRADIATLKKTVERHTRQIEILQKESGSEPKLDARARPTTSDVVHPTHSDFPEALAKLALRSETTQTFIVKEIQKGLAQHDLEKDAEGMRELRKEFKKGRWALFWKGVNYAAGGIILLFLAWALAQIRAQSQPSAPAPLPGVALPKHPSFGE
jgi:hypothetical protein